MGKRIPPTSSDVGQIVSDYMAAFKATPFRFVTETTAVEWVRGGTRTTKQNAEKWLLDAVEAGTVVMVRSSVEGRNLAQFKKNTMPDDRHRFMLDTIDGLTEGVIFGYTMAITGEVFLEDHREENRLTAPDGSDWVTTPELLREFVVEVNKFVHGKLTELSAEQTVKKGLIDYKCGPALDLIAGLLRLAGEKKLAIAMNPYVSTGEEIRLSITLRGEERINALGEVLKKAGVQPHDEWKKWMDRD